jgi:hypothetical protein
MAPARLRALEADATTSPQGPGLGFSGGGRDQRPAQTAVCTRYALTRRRAVAVAAHQEAQAVLTAARLARYDARRDEADARVRSKARVAADLMKQAEAAVVEVYETVQAEEARLGTGKLGRRRYGTLDGFGAILLLPAMPGQGSNVDGQLEHAREWIT